MQQDSHAYRLKVACLWLAPLLLIARALRAYYSWAVCLLHVTCLLIARVPSAYCLFRTYIKFFLRKYYNIATRSLKYLYLKRFQGGGRLVVDGGKLPFLSKMQQKVGRF